MDTSAGLCGIIGLFCWLDLAKDLSNCSCLAEEVELVQQKRQCRHPLMVAHVSYVTPVQHYCCLIAGALRLQLPSSEEINAVLYGRKSTSIIFFLDETFEELQYDIATTVLEAAELLAGIIKLREYSTFTLYESRKVSTPPPHRRRG